MRSASRIEGAIAWEIWCRSRGTVAWLAPLVVASSFVALFSRIGVVGGALAESIGYGVMVVAMFAVFGCFHYTEGRRRGGFGSFPARLFHLPVSTARLVALPMGYAALAVVATYLLVVGLVFLPARRMPPVLWPCLYLVNGMAMFQAIVWSLPESRYRKLFLLSLAASVIACGWMFFLPHMIEGTLSAWGDGISAADFQARLAVGLVAGTVAAYGIGLSRVKAQRHVGRMRWRIPFRIPGSGWVARDRSPFRSPRHAMLWHEWQQTGWLLPAAMSVILFFTALPVILSDELGPRATEGVLIWLGVAPFLLSAVLGTGVCKPDFWREDLSLPLFQSVKPVASGDWVLVKFAVAAASVILAWTLVVAGGALCLVYGGDFLVLQERLTELRLYYPGYELPLFAVAGGLCAVTFTWRLMVQLVWAGLSGRRSWHRIASGCTAATLVGLFVWLISQDSTETDAFRLHALWPWIEWSPVALLIALAAKSVAGVRAWREVERRGLLSPGWIVRCLAGWLLLTVPWVTLPWLMFGHTPWLRSELVLVALLLVPFASPALGILAHAQNRSSA